MRCYLCFVVYGLLAVNATHMARNMMGVPTDNCDDGNYNLQIDWDATDDREYTCQTATWSTQGSSVTEHCVNLKDISEPTHKCMDEAIVYNESIPTYGTHRPLWAIYGEYLYLPPQRWVHNLEHGAAVFLYHPCASANQVNKLRTLANRCLWKHVITPSRKLSSEWPMAVLRWGCSLYLQSVDYNEEKVIRFLQMTAKNAPEYSLNKEGQYDYGLISKAKQLSTEESSILCPKVSL